MRIGLTGGIGSGKSTVSNLLAEHGAVIVDADAIAREVVEPGTPGLGLIREEFGDEVITADGVLDRPALGAIVFADSERRRALEAITHPLIAERTAELFARAPADAVVVHDMPLLVELGQTDGYHLMVIVDVPEEVRLDRLVEQRGMNREDAQARVDAQATDAQRRAAADVLLDNSGSPEELHTSVNSLWENRIRPYADNLTAVRGVRRPDSVTIREPDPEWAEQGRRWCARLVHQLSAAGMSEVQVDHIGSTSVPGLAAKDVIDLQIQVPDLAVAQSDSFVGALWGAGVVEVRSNHDAPQPWAPDPEQWRKFYANGADPAQVVHVHIRTNGGPAATAALQFRDWLRANDEERDAYAEMKRALAAEHPGGTQETKQDYVQAKEPWFAEALPKARAWAQTSGWTMPG